METHCWCKCLVKERRWTEQSATVVQTYPVIQLLQQIEMFGLMCNQCVYKLWDELCHELYQFGREEIKEILLHYRGADDPIAATRNHCLSILSNEGLCLILCLHSACALQLNVYTGIMHSVCVIHVHIYCLFDIKFLYIGLVQNTHKWNKEIQSNMCWTVPEDYYLSVFII